MAYEEIIYKRSWTRDLKFSGEIVAEKTEDGTILRLYKTEGGNYVGLKTIPVISGLEDANTVTTVNEVQLTEPVSAGQTGVFDFFGWSDLAKELYLAAGIDPYQIIE